jgi:hypothetical protein
VQKWFNWWFQEKAFGFTQESRIWSFWRPIVTIWVTSFGGRSKECKLIFETILKSFVWVSRGKRVSEHWSAVVGGIKPRQSVGIHFLIENSIEGIPGWRTYHWLISELSILYFQLFPRFARENTSFAHWESDSANLSTRRSSQKLIVLCQIDLPISRSYLLSICKVSFAFNIATKNRDKFSLSLTISTLHWPGQTKIQRAV